MHHTKMTNSYFAKEHEDTHGIMNPCHKTITCARLQEAKNFPGSRPDKSGVRAALSALIHIHLHGPTIALGFT